MSFISPGVEWREFDFSTFAVRLAGTTFAAVGAATKGPVNTPTLLASASDLLRTFGTPQVGFNNAPDYSAMAINEFFKGNGNKRAIFTRLVGAGSSKSEVTLQDPTTPATDVLLVEAINEGVWGDSIAVNIVDEDPTDGFFDIQILTPDPTDSSKFVVSEYYDDVTLLASDTRNFIEIVVNDGGRDRAASSLIRVTALVTDSYPQGPTAAQGTVAFAGSPEEADQTVVSDGVNPAQTFIYDKKGTLVPAANEVQVDLTAAPSAVKATGNIVFSGIPQDGDYFELNDGINPTVRFEFDTNGTVVETATLRQVDISAAATPDDVVDAIVTSVAGAPTLEVTATDGGATANFENNLVGTDGNTAIAVLDGGATMTVTNMSGGVLPLASEVAILLQAAVAGSVLGITATVDTLDNTQVNLVNNATGAVGNIPITNTDTAAVQTITGMSGGGAATNLPPVPDAQQETPLTGGAEGASLVSGDYSGSSSLRTGVFTLSNTEEFDVNIVAIPGVSDQATVAEAIRELCEEVRRDCLGLIDPPFSASDPALAKAWRQNTLTGPGNINSSYTAIYWPWLYVENEFTRQKIWMPPSGFIAQRMAYTDTIAAVWFAPAGLNRGKVSRVLDIQYSTDRAEREILYDRRVNINSIIRDADVGFTVWGQRTMLSKPSVLQEVKNRRMLLYLEKVTASTVKFLVFEPNDPQMWRSFVNLLDPVFKAVKDGRGLIDYEIKADETTTTPDMQNNREFRGVIKLKPTTTAEIFTVDFQLFDAGASFSENG